jgi:phosphate transport system substrate-binding protein
MYAMKRMNNDMAVSPIVATLVLIVVAVIGAVAVGTIMGTFSGSVAKQVNSNGAASAASTGGDLLIAGSTTVYPASLILAQDYMNQFPATKITVQTGGSGAGVSEVGQGIIDIGASSSALTAAQMTEYPNLQAFQIGSRSVVWIVNKANTYWGTGSVNGLPATWAASNAVTPTQMDTFLGQNTADLMAGSTPADSHVSALVQRSDASGTESTAAKWAGYSVTGDSALDNAPIASASGSTAANGNAGVLADINGDSTGKLIGFVDLGYVFTTSGTLQTTASNVVVVPVTDSNSAIDTATAPTTGAMLRTDCLNSAKDFVAGNSQSTTNNYPQGLDSNLYYITNGVPTPLAQNFITFAQSPAGGQDLQTAGDFALMEVKV